AVAHRDRAAARAGTDRRSGDRGGIALPVERSIGLCLAAAAGGAPRKARPRRIRAAAYHRRKLLGGLQCGRPGGHRPFLPCAWLLWRADRWHELLSLLGQ